MRAHHFKRRNKFNDACTNSPTNLAACAVYRERHAGENVSEVKGFEGESPKATCAMPPCEIAGSEGFKAAMNEGSKALAAWLETIWEDT